jgi:cation:H+ antiporter
MTTPPGAARSDPDIRIRLAFVAALAIALPALWVRWTEPHLSHGLEAILFGLAIVGAAFLLAWAAEVAQIDIAAGLALALLALIAVLPEYAVDFVFTWKGGQAVAAYGASCPSGEPGLASPCSLALANMTGANRLLIGIGWSSVVFIAWYRSRRRIDGRPPQPVSEIRLARTHAVEIAFLGIATLYSLTLPLRHTLTLFDAVVLVGIFAAYAWRLSKAPAEEPDLQGVSAWVGGMAATPRRVTFSGLFVLAALVILACAEHFAEGLVQTGEELGVDPFILVQWVAPLASEAPELIVACLFAWRLKASDSLGTLLSSKVNQWTLLVGTIPIVFAISARTTDGLPIDAQQRIELLLTAAQSLFAVSILVTLALTTRNALALFVLFAVQFFGSLVLGVEADRILNLVLSGVYVLLAVVELVRHRRVLARTVRDGLRTPFDVLQRRDEELEEERTAGHPESA